jgi:hypothetical protein
MCTALKTRVEAVDGMKGKETEVERGVEEHNLSVHTLMSTP